MKIYKQLLVFIALLVGCHSEQILTYEMGYSNCKKIFEDNGGTGIYPRPNCLEGFNLPNFNAVSTLNDSINLNSLRGKPTSN